MGRHLKFAGQFARAQNLDALAGSVGQADAAQRGFVHRRAVVKFVERFQIHWNVTDGESLVVKSALGDAADQRHLAAFKSDANGTAGTGRLAFATATTGFAVAAGFTLAQPFPAVP